MFSFFFILILNSKKKLKMYTKQKLWSHKDKTLWPKGDSGGATNILGWSLLPTGLPLVAPLSWKNKTVPNLSEFIIQQMTAMLSGLLVQ